MKRLSYTTLSSSLLVLLLLLQTGCKKLVEPNAPGDKIGIEAVYANDKTAASVLTRLFAQMSSFAEASYGIPILLSLSGDDLKVAATIDQTTLDIYNNSMLKDGTFWWYDIYKYLYTTNDAIEQLAISTGVSPNVNKQLMGEAKFSRAFMYFYLVNIYGAVPLVTTTDYRATQGMGRTSTTEIYNLILSDLKEAKELLSKDYLNANVITITTERVRPTKAAATAMLARTYLYLGEYAKAEAEASELISNPTYGLIDLNSVFGKNSKETIWQLSGLVPRFNTQDGAKYILRSTTPGGPASPKPEFPFLASDFLLNAFETGDLRSTKWIGDSSGYKFINKYKVWEIDKPVTEYIMVLRLAEQYLIRAEARIRQNKIADGIADLNAVRTRARGTNPGDLPDLSTSLSQPDALTAVEHERQVELFTEWGHRWFDLRRTNRINTVMTTVTPIKSPTASWSPFRALWPLPAGEILAAPGLAGQQNPGYN